MKLGVFDSGLGGILIARAIRARIPDIDMMYLGDTLNLPYGNRSEEAIYAHARSCVEALFQQGCNLIVVACNTVSASALRRLQQQYLSKTYPGRRILGVVVPTIEEALDRGYQKLGLIGTNYTVASNIYEVELRKINPSIEIEQRNTPLLVPLIEHDGEAWIDDVLEAYLQGLERCEALLLGCTHYVHLKDRIRAAYDFDVLSQDEIIPHKLEDYLARHPEIAKQILRRGNIEFYVTDLTPGYQENASVLFGQNIELKLLEGVHHHAEAA